MTCSDLLSGGDALPAILPAHEPEPHDAPAAATAGAQHRAGGWTSSLLPRPWHSGTPYYHYTSRLCPCLRRSVYIVTNTYQECLCL